jgi:hypothetical protein
MSPALTTRKAQVSAELGTRLRRAAAVPAVPVATEPMFRPYRKLLSGAAAGAIEPSPNQKPAQRHWR